MRLLIFMLAATFSQASLADKGWNNFFYKVVRSGGKVINVDGCKQSDRPVDGSVAGFKIVGKNVKEHEVKFVGNSMYTRVDYDLNDMQVSNHFFSGSVGDMYKNGMEECKKHLRATKQKLDPTK